MKLVLSFLVLLFSQKLSIAQNMDNIVEIRSYNLKPGSGKVFNSLFLKQAMPLLKKWNIDVLAYGLSQDDENSFFLIRSFKNPEQRQKAEDAFYGSDEWRQGPREAILSLILSYTTIVLPFDSINQLSGKMKIMTSLQVQQTDSAVLSALNAQFIKNFLTQDVAAHSEIIHKNFICIESSGSIVPRDVYLKNWATDFDNSGYTSFSYTEEYIRIFGNMALVRAKTTYTKNINDNSVTGYTIYTDTYIKEDGRWQCVQVQITPVKLN